MESYGNITSYNNPDDPSDIYNSHGRRHIKCNTETTPLSNVTSAHAITQKQQATVIIVVNPA